ncbi:hypothetical protein AJ88_26430 [Mesorhizobium amorphae CCBAU 01583]|nr:hypothetical protein AJ88_26430 [Mesorhizobium amorphae CCBAU 01583]
MAPSSAFSSSSRLRSSAATGFAARPQPRRAPSAPRRRFGQPALRPPRRPLVDAEVEIVVKRALRGNLASINLGNIVIVSFGDISRLDRCFDSLDRRFDSQRLIDFGRFFGTDIEIHIDVGHIHIDIGHRLVEMVGKLRFGNLTVGFLGNLDRRRMFDSGSSCVMIFRRHFIVERRVIVECQLVLKRQGYGIVQIVIECGFDRRRDLLRGGVLCFMFGRVGRGMIVELEFLIERSGKLGVHRQVVVERRHVFQRAGDRLIEIITEGSLDLRRGNLGDGRKVIRRVVEYEILFERSRKLVVHPGGNRFESRLLALRSALIGAEFAHQLLLEVDIEIALFGKLVGRSSLRRGRRMRLYRLAWVETQIRVSSANGSSSAMSLWSAVLSWVLSPLLFPNSHTFGRHGRRAGLAHTSAMWAKGDRFFSQT